jgi:hypothetical protein
MVTLTATAASGAHFEGWSGSGCSGRSTCTVTVDASKAVTATFEPGPLALLRYKFDGDGTNSGSLAGYTETLNGTVTFPAGKFGQAAQFGSGAYGFVSGTRTVLSTYAQYTISYWVNATTPPVSTAILDFNNRSTAPYGGIQVGYGTSTTYSMCVSTTTNSFLTGSCKSVTAPAAGAWHNVIIRYAGTGTGAGQGGNVDVYEDGALVATVANDASNNPVFNPGIPDALYIGAAGLSFDEVRVYNVALTPAEQCAQIIGGAWTGSACTLP